MGADMLIAVAAAPVLADGTPVLDVEVISRCASAAFQSAATAGQVDPEAYWDIVDADTPTVAEIAAALDLNADRELERSQGYLPELPDGAAEFGAMRIARADKPGIRTRVNETDMARTEKMIRDAAVLLRDVLPLRLS